MESKKDIRKKIFAERKLRTDEQIEAMSLTITDKVTALPAFKNADRILVYADYNHEVVTEYLIKEAWKAGKEVAVPKVVGKDMVFYKLTDLARLEPGYFGIPEPVSGEIVNWSKALMIMPGVAFDRANHRVGYGGRVNGSDMAGGIMTVILRNIRSLKELPLHFLFRCCRRFPQNLLISVRRS